MIKIKKEHTVEFLKIGKNKLKITLTCEELIKYKLDKIGADDDLAPHRRSLFRVIDIAEKRTGFTIGAEKVLLQFYPIKRGGELFVTKLSILTDAQRNIISRANNLTTLMRSRRAYFFDNLNDAISLARSIVSRCEATADSALYITDHGSVVLEIEEYTADGKNADYPEITEFSDPLATDFFTYLREHSIPLYEENAIKSLASL
jgi:negative regulator of genetic competence, sporulation and motility